MSKSKIELELHIDLADYIDEIDDEIRRCIRDAVREGLYDEVKVTARRAFLASDLRDKVLPKMVDEVLRSLLKDATNGS